MTNTGTWLNPDGSTQPIVSHTASANEWKPAEFVHTDWRTGRTDRCLTHHRPLGQCAIEVPFFYGTNEDYCSVRVTGPAQ